MKISPANLVLGTLCLIGGGVNAFAPSHRHQRLSVADRTTSALNVNIPRLELPGAIADQLMDLDLKNPNNMDAEEIEALRKVLDARAGELGAGADGRGDGAETAEGGEEEGEVV